MAVYYERGTHVSRLRERVRGGASNLGGGACMAAVVAVIKVSLIVWCPAHKGSSGDNDISSFGAPLTKDAHPACMYRSCRTGTPGGWVVSQQVKFIGHVLTKHTTMSSQRMDLIGHPIWGIRQNTWFELSEAPPFDTTMGLQQTWLLVDWIPSKSRN